VLPICFRTAFCPALNRFGLWYDRLLVLLQIRQYRIIVRRRQQLCRIPSRPKPYGGHQCSAVNLDGEEEYEEFCYSDSRWLRLYFSSPRRHRPITYAHLLPGRRSSWICCARYRPITGCSSPPGSRDGLSMKTKAHCRRVTGIKALTERQLPEPQAMDLQPP